MSLDYNSIIANYSDQKLRILVEEYLTMQKHEFSFKAVCSYVLYRAIEEERTDNIGLYESNQLSITNGDRIICILKKIIKEGRITSSSESIANDTKFVKLME